MRFTDRSAGRRTSILGLLAVALCLCGWPAASARAAIPPAPGGPILVVHGTDRFGGYLDEILRAEGLQEFAAVDGSGLDASALAGRQLVLLGPTTVTDAQASMLTAWVQGGGDLIAMRPDPKLYGLLGVSAAGGTVGDGDVRVDTTSAPGAGITGSPMQFHGTADRLTAGAGVRGVAQLLANGTPTGNPAVTLRAVGNAGGQAAAFAYDLGRSVVYTHQGNPAWAGQERDGAVDQGTTTIRPDDLFFGGSLPDYVDLGRVQIPQADEQQRLLANMITSMASDRLPVPRLWYLPRGAKAAVVMTGDEHATGQHGTEFAFDRFKAQSPPGCSVADWQCVRASAYVFAQSSVAPDAAKAYEDQGFEIGLHLRIPGPSECNNYTSYQQVKDALDQQLDGGGSYNGFLNVYAALRPPDTIRTHCIVWSDWDSEVRADLSRGIRLNTDYYYWPPSWVNGRSGMFTGSGFPMRYAAQDGSLYDVFQATTQVPDETFTNGDDMAAAIKTLLDGAVGPQGYYGAFTANVHNDLATPSAHATADAIVAAAQAHGVPVVSAHQMLTWLDARDASSFGDLQFAGGVLTFAMDVGTGARGLQAMLPVHGPAGDLTGLTRDGQAVPLVARTVKGVDYLVFDAAAGRYAARYTGGGGGTPPPPSRDVGGSAGSPSGGTSATPGSGAGSGSSPGAGGGSGSGSGSDSGMPVTGRSTSKPKVYDRTPPRLVLGGARRQRFATAIGITLRAASENLWASVRTTIQVAGQDRALHLTTASNRFVAKAHVRVLRLSARPATLRSLRRALAAHLKVTATITVRARDAAGNVTTRTRTVLLLAP